MPELPDVEVYRERLEALLKGSTLEAVRLKSPFLLRTASPPLSQAIGRKLLAVRRLGKRLVFAMEGDLFLVVHLMIAGRFHWKPIGAAIAGKVGLAAFDFTDRGTLLLTEASKKKRAALFVLQGEAALVEMDRGGIEPLTASLDDFRNALQRENHTLKRSLTDPRLFSGIGNAYSDELLHRARLSPLRLSQSLTPAEVKALFNATQKTLIEWTDLLRRQTGDGFPEKVTAFRPEMAVHGKYREPCPDCGAPIQRIVYAENETNYCAHCQNQGRLLADRSLSRLLKDDWPSSPEALEELRTVRPARS
jgi:formamidopyrimidine-DNA glycosylase